MARRKARRPAPAETVHEPPATAEAGELKRRDATAQPLKLQSVFDGRCCIGHILARGRTSFEAFDSDQNSLGVFPTVQEAVAAIPTKGAAR